MVEVRVKDVMLKVLTIDTVKSTSELMKGSSVNILFKETEVIIGKGSSLPVSLPNQLPGRITKLTIGSLLSKLELDTNVGQIYAIIPSESINRLALKVDDEICAMVKTNEMMLSI